MDRLGFLVNQDRSATGALEPPRQKQPSGQSFKVQVNILYAIIEEGLPAPDFIKIDIEGHELEALKGMHETIIRHKPASHVESHGIKKHDVVRILFADGYKILQVAEEAETKPDQLDRVRDHLQMNCFH